VPIVSAHFRSVRVAGGTAGWHDDTMATINRTRWLAIGLRHAGARHELSQKDASVRVAGSIDCT